MSEIESGLGDADPMFDRYVTIEMMMFVNFSLPNL